MSENLMKNKLVNKFWAQIILAGALFAGNQALNAQKIIPFYQEGAHIYVEADIGSDFQVFLFDTGAASNLISLDFARNNHLQLGEKVNVMSFGGMQTGFKTIIPQLTIEGETYEDVACIAIEKITSADQAYDAVLGMEFVKESRLTIDYENEQMLIEPSSGKGVGEHPGIPLFYEANIPAVEVVMKVGGTEVKGKVVLDSGADAFVIVMDGTDAQTLLYDHIESFVEQVTYSPGGAFVSKVGRAEELQLHHHVLNKVPFKVMAPTQQAKFINGYIGFMGYHVLNQYKIIIDTPQQLAWLIPYNDIVKQYHVDLSGISIRMNSKMEIEVRNVLKNSAGEKAGLQVGDILLKVNDESTHNMFEEDIMEIMSTQIGDEVVLQVRRNNQEKQLIVVLEDVI